MSQHIVTITGNIAHDPILTQHKNSLKLVMRVASSRRYSKIAENNVVEWHETDLLYVDVEAWGDLAAHMKKSLVKGMPVIVVGALNSSTYDDKDGVRRTRVFVRATQVGLDLNRYIISSRKTDNAVVPDGMTPPDESPAVPDRDFTQDTQQDTAADSQAAHGDVPAGDGAEAGRELAAAAARAGEAEGPEQNSGANPGENPSSTSGSGAGQPPF